MFVSLIDTVSEIIIIIIIIISYCFLVLNLVSVAVLKSAQFL